MEMTHSGPYRKALTTDSTSPGFTSLVAKTTKPSGAGVIDLRDSDLGISLGHDVPKFITVKPYGKNKRGLDFKMRVWGWNSFDNDGTKQWEPVLLTQADIHLGQIKASKGDDSFDPDVITVTGGHVDSVVVSGTPDTTSFMVIDHMGSELLEFDFERPSVSVTGMNALYKPGH